jgi:hypothetical protein
LVAVERVGDAAHACAGLNLEAGVVIWIARSTT